MDINNSFVIIGRAGSGKTTFINQKIISNLPTAKKYAIDHKEGLQGVERLATIEELIEKAKKYKNSLFIIDDASGNLRKGNSNNIDELIRLLSVRRHDNNYYVFVFHSIFFFPQRLESLIDYFIFADISEKQKDLEKYFCSFNENEIKAATMKKGLYRYVVIKK